MKVGSRELKNRLGRYLLAVRQGQTLIITDRGKPVARLTPTEETGPVKDPIQARLQELEAQGLIHLGSKPLRKIRTVKNTGKPASRIIIEERR